MQVPREFKYVVVKIFLQLFLLFFHAIDTLFELLLNSVNRSTFILLLIHNFGLKKSSLNLIVITVLAG